MSINQNYINIYKNSLPSHLGSPSATAGTISGLVSESALNSKIADLNDTTNGSIEAPHVESKKINLSKSRKAAAFGQRTKSSAAETLRVVSPIPRNSQYQLKIQPK